MKKDIYLVIRENNKWEHESWNFCFNIEDNDCELLSSLILLTRRISDKNLKVFVECGRPGCIAVSTYSIIITTGEHIKEQLNRPTSVTYMSRYNVFDTKISPKKLRSIIKKANNYIDDYENSHDPFYKGGISSIVYKK